MTDVSFLKDFLRQSRTGDLKTKGLYPESILDLDLKVSFGVGKSAHVPWISFLSLGMSTQNGYYPLYLYYKDEQVLVLAYGISETVEYDEPWSQKIMSQGIKASELLNKPVQYDKSYVFKSYDIVFSGEEIEFFSADQALALEDLSADLEAIVKEYKECLDITIKDESSDLSKSLFYMEKQLEDFIIQNWEESEFGKKYDLIEEDGVLVSQQYKTDIGFIDILAKDRKTGDYVVIELKRNQTSDDTVGQIARYMGWVGEHRKCTNVRGIIVCGKYDKKLDYARKMMKDIEVFLYQVDFNLREYKR